MSDDRTNTELNRTREEAGTTDRRSKAGVKRRTVLAGAAWSVPAISLMAATPLAAASTTGNLKFANGPYSAEACGSLGDVTLNLTSNGTAPDAGKTVTVVLPAGLSWSDASTGAKVFTPTDASGNITIPAGQILASVAGSHVISATSNTGANATAPVTVGPKLRAIDWNSTGGTILTFNQPAAVAIGWNFFLGPDNALYHGDNVIANNVSSAVADSQGDAANGVLDGVAYVDENGTAQVWSWNPNGNVVNSATYSAVPSGSTTVGWPFFLTSAGDLYHGDTLVDSGVTSAVGEVIVGPTDAVTYVSNGQAKIYLVSSADPTNPTKANFPAVPTGATAVGHNFLLAANGDLYHSGGELVASGVTAAVGDQLGDAASGATDGVSFVQNGVSHSWQWFPSNPTAPTSTTYATVPAGATPVGWNFFLAPGGALYHGNDLVAQNVVSAVGGEYLAGVDGVIYVASVPC